MLTNQDRRAILEQVKASESGDIMAALQGQPVLPQQEQVQQQQVQQEPASIPPSTPPPVNNVSMETPPVGQNSLVNSFSNTSPQIQDLPNGSAEPQLLRTGGVKSHGGLHTAEASSTAVAPVNIPTIITPETDQEKIIRLATQQNSGSIYDPTIGNNPNKQWISGASNQMYASNKAKQRTQDYNETILGFAAPVPLLNSMKVSASGAKIPGLIDDVILGPVAKGYGKVKSLIKPKTNTKVVPTTKGTKTYDEIIEFDRKQKNYVKNKIYKPSSTELDEIQRLKNRNIKYIQSDEYVSKRMANTGESKESILSQVKDYIKELNETPITFQTAKNMDKGTTLGFYKSGDIFENTSSKLQIQNPTPTNSWYMFNRGIKPKLDSKVSGIVDHEIKHLLSPTQKLDKTSSTYKLYNSPKFKAGRKKYSQALDDINDKFMKATSKEEANKILNMYNKVPNKEIFDGTFTSKLPNMNKVYKNYPTLNIKSGKIGSAGTEAGEYLGRAQEQQPRLLRGAEWLKLNFKWDGTKSGMTDDMLKNIHNQMENSTNLGGKTKIPNDFRELLQNTSNVTYSKLKDVLSKAWAVGPVAVGVGAASEKKSGGFKDPQEKLEIDYSNPPVKKKKLATTGKETSYRQSMMHFLHDTNKVDTNYVNNIMQVVAEHESKNVDDAIQVSGNKKDGFYPGPARGAYQYEIGIDQGGSTAMNRNASFTRDSTDRSFSDFPTVYTEGKKESPDFSTLSREDQDGLFLGDKMNKNKSSSKAFYDLVKNDGTSPTSDEAFEFWGKNHKRVFAYTIQTKRGEETVKYTYDNLPADKKALELKKWRANTKDMFRTGGFSEYTTNSKTITKSKQMSDLEIRADNVATAFNEYTNPTLLNNKNLNLRASLGVDSKLGWNPNDTNFSKYGSPTLNLGGSLGLAGTYRANDNLAFRAGANFKTGERPKYSAGLTYSFKKGGYER